LSLQPGSRFGTFEIVSPLGAGGMGEVYLIAAIGPEAELRV